MTADTPVLAEEFLPAMKAALARAGAEVGAKLIAHGLRAADVDACTSEAFLCKDGDAVLLAIEHPDGFIAVAKIKLSDVDFSKTH